MLTLVIGSVLFSSCKGDDGAIGAAGAKGDAGAAGPAGPKGDKGDTGTANVIYSPWIALSDTAVENQPSRKNFTIAAPSIIQESLDKDLIYAYLKHSGGTIVPLPYLNKYIFTNGTVSGSYLTTIIPHVGRISLNQDWQTPGTIPAAFETGKTIQGGYTHLRYIIVAGGIPAARQAGVDLTDYNAVKAFFHSEV